MPRGGRRSKAQPLLVAARSIDDEGAVRAKLAADGFLEGVHFYVLPAVRELAELSLVCPKLATLLCAGCTRLPDEQLRLAIKSCRNLATCDVKGCELLTAETAAALEQPVRPAQLRREHRLGS